MRSYEARGYEKPAFYRGSWFVDEALPVTGRNRNAKLLVDQRSTLSSTSSSSAFTCGKTGKLDTMSNSLDDIIIDRRVSQDENDIHGEIHGEHEGFYEKRKRLRVRREFQE
jgi:hypothetical protein